MCLWLLRLRVVLNVCHIAYIRCFVRSSIHICWIHTAITDHNCIKTRSKMSHGSNTCKYNLFYLKLISTDVWKYTRMSLHLCRLNGWWIATVSIRNIVYFKLFESFSFDPTFNRFLASKWKIRRSTVHRDVMVAQDSAIIVISFRDFFRLRMIEVWLLV